MIVSQDTTYGDEGKQGDEDLAGMVGSVTSFDSKSQSWEEYCEVLNNFFVANDVESTEKKQVILLSCVGAQTYTLMRNLLSPDKPGAKSFEELVY